MTLPPARLSPRVLRLTENNPGPFTGPGTNSFVVGDPEPDAPLLVVDPGEGDPAHLRAVLEAVGKRPVEAILVTHAHDDHWRLAPGLAESTGAPIVAFSATAGLEPDRTIADGAVVTAGGTSLEAIHLPGHSPDHLGFLLEEERALLVGDHVMAWSSTIIAPPEGDLDEYLRSLDRLDALDLDVLHSGHGEAIGEPAARIAELRAHRLERTRQALAALQAVGPAGATVEALVERIYTDVDPSLHPAAAYSLRAHLEALERAGRVERDERRSGSLYRLV